MSSNGGLHLLDPDDLWSHAKVRRGSHPDVSMATGGHLQDLVTPAHFDRNAHDSTSFNDCDVSSEDDYVTQPTFMLTQLEEGEREEIAQDSDYDTDLEEKDEELPDEGPVGCYLRACEEMGVVPVSYFLRNISTTDLVMKHRGLGPRGAKALAVPLLMNTCIACLDLEGNQLEAEGVRHVIKVLQDNIYITHLNLSYNHLKSKGAAYVCEILKNNKSIISLELAGNGFDDNDGLVFQELLETNNAIKFLNLSDNEFSGPGATAIGYGLAGNVGLEELDLSWNHIRCKGAEGFAEGLKENDKLTRLCLNMNGFSTSGLKALVSALETNSSLVELDVTNNRIDVEGCKMLAKLLRQHTTLETLKIGLNPIGYDGAEILLSSIMDNLESVLSFLDLAGIVVTEDFMTATQILSCRRSFEVKVGRVSAAVCLNKGENQWKNLSPLETLLVFMAEKNLRLMDLFKELDKDGSMALTRQEFIRGLQAVNTPLSDGQLNQLIDMLDKDGDGEVDLREIMNINNEFRNMKLKAMKIARARKTERENHKFQETTVAVIAANSLNGVSDKQI